MSTFTVGGFTRTAIANSSVAEVVHDDGETKPSQVSNDYWIYETSTSHSSSPGGGKWMLFYRNKDIDAAWIKAKTCMRSGILAGIAAMKVSTARENARASDKDSQVIIFYCGPPDDEDSVVRYGKNLVEAMNYVSINSNPHVYYKSDEQTVAGTKATGQRKNHLYKIRVPTGGSDFALASNNQDGATTSIAGGTRRSGKRRLTHEDDEVEETRKRMICLSPTHLRNSHPTLPPNQPESANSASTSVPSSSFSSSSSTSSSETTRIKFRLENVPMDDASATIIASFHIRQRLTELVGYLASQMPTSLAMTGSWTLLKTFPTEELTDLSLTLEEVGLRNAVVIARRN